MADSLRVSLKPRARLAEMARELKENEEITSLELNVHKNFLKEAVNEELERFFDAIGAAPGLKKLVLNSKGSATQEMSIENLAICISENQGLEEIQFQHIKLKGSHLDYDDLASAIGDHPNLKVLVLQVENLDKMNQTIEAAGHLPTLEKLTVESASEAANNLQLLMTIQSLCASESLKSLDVTNIVQNFERMIPMMELLRENTVLEEWTVTATECNREGGMALAQMLHTNNTLKRFVLHVNQLNIKGPPEDAIVAALAANPTLEHFELKMDGRMSDMMVVRKMQKHFKDDLKDKFTVKMQAGMDMKVTCDRIMEGGEEAD